MSKPFHGLTPIKYRVIVRPEHDDGTITTASGFTLLKPDQTTERDQMSVVEGEIIAVSPMAFTWDEWPKDAPPPKAGDWVVFASYSGKLIKGNDGEEYRIMNDDDIMAVRDRDASQVVKVA